MNEVETKRKLNEKKLPHWEELPNGGRRYWYELIGRAGYKARYIKEVDHNEDTIKFSQEIYDVQGNLIEIHEKYPRDLGHRKIRRKE